MSKRDTRDGTGSPSPQEGLGDATPRAREVQDWQRPPFEPGNAAAMTHGAYSAGMVEKTADEVWADIEEQLRQLPGWLDVDRLLTDELREVVGQLVLLRKHRRKVGVLDKNGDPRSFWPLEDKLGRRLLDLAKALGMGTAERAKVFGAFMAAGRAQAEAEAARQRIVSRLTDGRRKRRVNKPTRKPKVKPSE